MKFEPVFRIAVMSDIHYKTDVPDEPERFKRGMELAYDFAERSAYKNLDALYVVGDFANRGQEDEMTLFKKSLDECVLPGTETALMLASHEFMCEGVEAAYEKLGRIFGKAPDEHKVINGFHCISLSCDRGCRIDEPKRQWLKEQLELAAADDWKKPIFVFQHPHLSGTVYGSINWGEDDIMSILMNYPQVIDFSGHSHAPINDPRSVHQKFFTSFGTGSLSYFELDEFTYQGGTVPANAHECAQFLIVEADALNRVLVTPLDILTGMPFNDGCLIEKPYDTASFIYTENRALKAEKPFFSENTVAEFTSEGEQRLSFTQADGRTERVDSYTVIIKDPSTGRTVRQISETSSYYLREMPEKVSVSLDKLPAGTYRAEIYACGFWNNISDCFVYDFEVSND